MGEIQDSSDPLPWFIDKYGQEKGERLYWSGQAYGCIGASWECRDCIVLDLDEYFVKVAQRHKDNPTKDRTSSGDGALKALGVISDRGAKEEEFQ
jgi:hypothetical protein